MTCEICITHGKLCPMCEIKQLTEERDEFMGYAKDGTVIAAQQLMEINSLKTDRDRLRAALENCKPVMESHAGTTRLALFNESLKGPP